MTSILTNNGAMVALQTLKSVNSNLEETQNQISTGKEVGMAKDNSAVWAISKSMESDIQAYEAVSDALDFGEATVAVASSGMEQIVETLKEMRELAVAGKSQNVDHAKIEADLVERRATIESIIDSASFNGANLLDDAVTTQLDVLGGLDPANDTITITALDTASNLDTSSMTGLTISNADTVLSEIETMITFSIDSAATLGAASNRLSDQESFVSKLTDSLKSGVSTMTDTNMEEASARLKALQTQQQLAVQSLTIANQAPSTLQQLFR
ncbi:flagellin N-terminal helical domain-containing protein [Leisingera sp. ANG-Vp]|uniref:flagellin N-terminal helical domain-containing protein n=1 Tax=Leisingera sp. ANG-Vp TaxID=1577896 RepID=UPI00057D33F1|nr:flagellin [Leisingera sp. ANG-Vp]KIC20656.1 flagellin [Leisingera sp. ANG-Vp]